MVPSSRYGIYCRLPHEIGRSGLVQELASGQHIGRVGTTAILGTEPKEHNGS